MSSTADKTVLDGLEKQNGLTIGRVLGRGNVEVAEEGADGKMHATVRIPLDELIFDPRVVVMPHGGTLELEIINDDNNSHCAVLPCNGDAKFIWLVNFSKGRATLELDGGAAVSRAVHPRARRPWLLLVWLPNRKRRGRGLDRHDRRRR